MILWPCLHCTFKPYCRHNESIRSALKGQHVTVASVKCSVPFDQFPPGSRANVVLIDYRYGYDYGERQVAETYEGTVLRKRGRKVQLWLDEESPSGRTIISVYPDRLNALPGMVQICPECRRPENRPEVRKSESSGNDKFQCWKCDGYSSWEDWLYKKEPLFDK